MRSIHLLRSQKKKKKNIYFYKDTVASYMSSIYFIHLWNRIHPKFSINAQVTYMYITISLKHVTRFCSPKNQGRTQGWARKARSSPIYFLILFFVCFLCIYYIEKKIHFIRPTLAHLKCSSLANPIPLPFSLLSTHDNHNILLQEWERAANHQFSRAYNIKNSFLCYHNIFIPNSFTTRIEPITYH